MRRMIRSLGCIGAVLASLQVASGQERIELESIYVKGNKEFPQTLYIVPWQDVKARSRQEQPLTLHSLFGDLFDPLYGADDTPAAPKPTRQP